MNSFKTIFTRFQSVKEGKKFDPDNEPLSNVEKSLNRVGIAIRKDKDHFKDFDVVLEDIGKKWKSFNDIQKSTIVSSLGGTRQGENLRILFENMEQVHNLQEKMVNATGSAKQKFDSAYGESTEAKINQLKRSVEQLYMTLINSNAINKFVGGVKHIVDFLNTLSETSLSTKISLIALSGTLIILIKNFGTLTTLLKSANLVGLMSFFSGSVKDLGMAIMGLVTNPLTILIAVLGTATYAIIKHTKHQKELKQQTDDLKNSYKDLTKAMKENNIESLKQDAPKFQKVQDELQKAIKEKKEAEKILNSYKSNSMNMMDSGGYGQARANLDLANKKIKEQIKVLKDAGIAFNETTGQVYAFDQAQAHLINNDTAEKLNKEKESAIKHKDELISLIQEYQHLSSVENANSTQKERMSQIARQLGSEISDLVIVTDADGNATIRNTQLLDGKVQMIEKEKDAIITKYTVLMENSKNEAIIEMNGTTTTYQEVQKRIKAIEAEINEWNKLLAAKARANNFNPQENPEDSREESLYLRNKAYKNKQISGLKDLLSEVDDIYKTYKAPDLPTPSGGSGGGGSSGYMPPSSGGGSKKSSADKAKKDAEKAQREAEQALKKALDNAINQYDTAIKTIENKIANARNRMDLYNEDGDKWGNRVVLTKQIETFTNQKISQLEAKKRFIQNSINSGKYEADTVKDLKSKILDIDGALSDVYTSLKKIKVEIIDETYKQKTVEIVKEVERLKNKMEEIDSADTFNKQKLNYMDSMIEKIKQQRDVTQSYVNELERQRRVTNDIATRSALEDSIKKYREELQSLQIEIIKSMTDRKNLIKDLTFEIEKLDEFNRVIEETNENLRKHNYLLADLDLQIELLKEKMDFEGVDKLYGDYISAMNGKIVELRNQSKELSSAMDGLQKEFKLKFGVDISSMSKKDLNNLYQSMFATRVTDSKEEKEALEKQAELFKQLMEDYYQLTEAIQENGEALGGMTNDILKKQKEQADYRLSLEKEVQDKTKEMMLKRKDDEKKILDERTKNLRESIEQRKKIWNDEFKNEDYNRDLQKKKDEELQIIAEIESKRRDTSLQGQAEVKRLEEELAKLQEDIASFERQHNRDKIMENYDDQLEKAEKENEEANKKLDEFYSDENLNKMSYEAIANGYFKDIHGNTIMLKDAMIDYIKTTSDGLSVIGQKIQDEIIAKLIGLQVFFKNGLNFGGINNIGTPISNPIVMNPIGGGIGDNGSIDIGKLIGGNIQPIIPNPIMPTPIVNIPMGGKTNENPIMFNIDCINKIEGNMYDTNDLIRMIEQGGTKVIQTVQDYFNGKGWRTSF